MELKRSIVAMSILFYLSPLFGCTIVRRASSVGDIQQAMSFVDRGTLHLRAGKLDDAEAAFVVAKDLAELPASIDGLGCVAFLRGDLSTAEKLFIEAYTADTDYVNSLGNLALVYDARGEKAQAEMLFRRAVSEDPGNFRVRGNFGAILADSLLRESSKAELLKAQVIAPHPLIRENLRRLE